MEFVVTAQRTFQNVTLDFVTTCLFLFKKRHTPIFVPAFAATMTNEVCIEMT